MVGPIQVTHPGRKKKGKRRQVDEVRPRPPSILRLLCCFRAAWLALCAITALLPGCAFISHDDTPATLLRARILPPPDFKAPAEILPLIPRPRRQMRLGTIADAPRGDEKKSIRNPVSSYRLASRPGMKNRQLLPRT